MAPQNILLFGATGAIGRFILNALLAQRSQFGRIAIFTSPRTAETKGEQLKKQGIEVIVGSIEDESAVKAAYEGKYTHTHTHTQSASPSSMDYTSNPPLYSLLYTQPTTTKTNLNSRNNNRNLRAGSKHPRPPNPPNPPRRRQSNRQMVLPIRIRHRHRLQPRLGPRKAPPAETQGARRAGKRNLPR